jgi:hypothetical protein
MKHFHRLTKVISLGGIVFVTPLTVWQTAFAANTAVLSLSPSSGNYTSGSTLSIKVYENSGSDSINAVQANLSYSTTQLRYDNFSSSSALPIEAENPTGDTGSLHFARGTTTPITGIQQVVTIQFTVIASSGTASINFASGSAVVRSTDNKAESLSYVNGTYTVPVASRSPSPKNNVGPTNTPVVPVYTAPVTNTSSKSAPNANSGNLAISNIQASNNPSSRNTVITWQSNKPATSRVYYGTDKSHLISLSDANLVTNHSIALPSSMLKSGNTYLYYVSSTDSSGQTISSQLLPFVAAEVNQPVSNNRSIKYTKQVAAVFVFMAVAIIMILIAGRLRHRMQAAHELNRHFPNLPHDPIVQGPTEFSANQGPNGKSIQPNRSPALPDDKTKKSSN